MASAASAAATGETLEISKLKQILTKPTNERKQIEIQKLQVALQEIEFFRKLDRDVGKECCKVLGYQFLTAGETVFEEGDPGTCFYVILEGSVGVFVKEAKTEDDPSTQQAVAFSKGSATTSSKTAVSKATNLLAMKRFASTDTEPVTPVLKGKGLTRKPTQAQVALADGKKNFALKAAQLLGSKGKHQSADEDDGVFGSTKAARALRQVATLFRGMAFGEVALQTDQPRTATIKAIAPSHLAFLDRNDYHRVLKGYYDKVAHDIYQYLKGVAMFSDWPDQKLSRLAPMFVTKKLVKGQCLCKEGTPITEVYFVKEGEFEIRKKFAGGKDYIVTIISPPQSIGLNEYLLGISDYQTGVVCGSSSGVALAITISKLTSRLTSESRDQLAAAAKQLTEFRGKRIEVLKAIHSLGDNNKIPQSLDRSKSGEDDEDWLRRLNVMVSCLSSEYSTAGRLSAIHDANGKDPIDVFSVLAEHKPIVVDGKSSSNSKSNGGRSSINKNVAADGTSDMQGVDELLEVEKKAHKLRYENKFSTQACSVLLHEGRLPTTMNVHKS